MLSQLIAGILMVVAGAAMLISGFFTESRIVLWIYGVVLFFLGLAVLINKNENKIEEIRFFKTKKNLKRRKK